jgi:hypothetical protein
MGWSWRNLSKKAGKSSSSPHAAGVFVTQIKVPRGTFICAMIFCFTKNTQLKTSHFVMLICVFINKTSFWKKLIIPYTKDGCKVQNLCIEEKPFFAYLWICV